MQDQLSTVGQLQEELLVLHDYYNDSEARIAVRCWCVAEPLARVLSAVVL